MTRLHDLYQQQGQSPWLDNLKRGWITSGELQRWVERGVRGITSNPTIFQKAMSTGSDYDAQFGDGFPPENRIWTLQPAASAAASASGSGLPSASSSVNLSGIVEPAL